jgi:tetratricopeptide (TPR) repeat protein
MKYKPQDIYRGRDITTALLFVRRGFMLLCLLWMGTGRTGFAAEAADPNGSSPAGSSPSVKDVNSDEQTASKLVLKTWENRIASPQRADEEISRRELRQLIEQIRRIKLGTEKESMAEEPVGTASKKVEVNEPSVIKQEPEKKVETATVELPVSSTGISLQTLQMLDKLVAHPEQANNPAALAEILYRTGCMKEAGVFYREAFERTTAASRVSADDRAWFLFQRGNCLRNYEPLEAMKTYRLLIEKYPNSLWTNSAKAREQLIGWYQKEKPAELTALAVSKETQENPPVASGKN